MDMLNDAATAIGWVVLGFLFFILALFAIVLMGRLWDKIWEKAYDSYGKKQAKIYAKLSAIERVEYREKLERMRKEASSQKGSVAS